MTFRPAPYNPRTISPAALAGLRVSLRTFGDLSGFVVNDRTGHVVCGHQRRIVLDDVDWGSLAYGEFYVVALGHPGQRFESREREATLVTADGVRFRVRRVDWPVAFEKAANVAANSPAIAGVFTDDLDLLLDELQSEGPDLYDALLLDELRKASPVDEAGADPDAAPEVPAVPVTRRGDLWELGHHRLLCGDATDRDEMRRLLEGRSVSLVFTDPPYNMAYKSKKLGGIANDDLGEAAFVRLILASAHRMLASLCDGGSFYLCMSAAEVATVFHQLRKLGMKARQIVWAKPSPGLGAQEYRPQHEVMLFGFKGARSKRVWNGGRCQSDLWSFDPECGVVARESEGGGMVIEVGLGIETVQIELTQRLEGHVRYFDGSDSDVWSFGRPKGDYCHPTQKPVDLVVRAIRNSSRSGDRVLDSFAGSGTTLIACELTGRRGCVMELDQKYCDVICRRYLAFTGTSPVRDDGVSFSELQVDGQT